MISIILAISGYFLAALVFVLDRYILKTSIPKPSVYAYFTGLFSLFALGFIPFGFEFSRGETIALSLLSGMIFVYGLVALYSAIRMNGITRIAPLVGAMVPTIIFFFSFLGCIVTAEMFTPIDMVAVFFLVIGGIILSIELPFQSRIFFRGFSYAILASLLIAIFFMGFKQSSQDQNFVSVFVWSRLGMVGGSFSLLLFPVFRREIFSAHHQSAGKEKKKEQWGTWSVFLTNKILASISYLCVSLAVTLGSVTIVQALGSVQYVFVLLLGGMATFFFPKIFRERLFGRFGLQMTTALVCITVGTVLTGFGSHALK